MKRMRTWLAAGLAVAGVLGTWGCGRSPDAADGGAAASAAGSVEAVDALGRRVVLASPARKLLVTGKAAFAIEDVLYLFPTVRESCEVVLSQGLGGAQRTGAGRFLDAFRGAGGGGRAGLSEGNAEEILARDPDVVLLKTSARLFGEALEGAGVKEAFLELESAAAYERDLKTLGTLLGAEGEAEAIWSHYREILDRVAAGTAEAERRGEERPRVLLVQYNSSRGTGACRVPPPDWIQTWMVETAGGVAVWKDGTAPGQWGAASPEQALAWDPDVILAVCYGESATVAAEALGNDPVWRESRAWKSGRVHAFPGDFLSWDQPDARWCLGLLWTAQTLHPDVFADVDLEAELVRFYALYGLDAGWVAGRARPLVKEPLAKGEGG